MLAFYKKITGVRENSPSLKSGDLRYLYASDGVLLYERMSGGERAVCAVNCGGDAVSVSFCADEGPYFERMEGLPFTPKDGRIETELLRYAPKVFCSPRANDRKHE